MHTSKIIVRWRTPTYMEAPLHGKTIQLCFGSSVWSVIRISTYTNYRQTVVYRHRTTNYDRGTRDVTILTAPSATIKRLKTLRVPDIHTCHTFGWDTTHQNYLSVCPWNKSIFKWKWTKIHRGTRTTHTHLQSYRCDNTKSRDDAWKKCSGRCDSYTPHDWPSRRADTTPGYPSIGTWTGADWTSTGSQYVCPIFGFVRTLGQAETMVGRKAQAW